jgi:hypothetical protein
MPALSLVGKKGWHLALDEINGPGGVLRRPLQVVGRDDRRKSFLFLGADQRSTTGTHHADRARRGPPRQHVAA